MTNRNGFGLLLEQLKLSGLGIEIGVSEGHYSRVLLSQTKLQRIYFVDPWKQLAEYGDYGSQAHLDQVHARVVNDFKKYGDRAVILRKDSATAVADFPDAHFDFIYIDASHAYDHVKQDLAIWYPKLKAGGVFAGHDYIYQPPIWEVKPAVDEFCARLGIEPMVTGGSRRVPPSWYWVKPHM